ncbi:MAG: hypothetical protein AAB729_01580, partial [Patescibacteria group bacterium]
MLWMMVKYCREGLVLVMVEAGFSMFASSRWFELLVFTHGLAWVVAAMVGKSRGWKAPAESPLTRLSTKFQGEDGFPFLLLMIGLPVLLSSMFAGWAMRRLC